MRMDCRRLSRGFLYRVAVLVFLFGIGSGLLTSDVHTSPGSKHLPLRRFAGDSGASSQIKVGRASRPSGLIAPDSPPDPGMQTQARIAQSFATLPLAFEPNRGQTDPQVRYLARGSDYALFLTGDEAVLALKESGFSRHELRCSVFCTSVSERVYTTA